MPLTPCQSIALSVMDYANSTMVPLDGVAWSFPNLTNLFGDIDRTTEDIDIPRGDTILTPDWDVPMDHILEGWIIGDCDHAGTPVTDTLAGWTANVGWLRSNVTKRVSVAPIHRVAELSVGATVLTAHVKAGPLTTGTVSLNEDGAYGWSGYFSPATMRLRVYPPGWVTGS